jgi:hypothetical protein
MQTHPPLVLFESLFLMRGKSFQILGVILACSFLVGCKSIERANAKAIARNVDSALSAYQAEHGTLPRKLFFLTGAGLLLWLIWMVWTGLNINTYLKLGLSLVVAFGCVLLFSFLGHILSKWE